MTPLYTLSDGTMSGTVTADLYAQTGGLTSGTVGGAQYDLSAGTLTGTSNSATFNLSGAGSVGAAGTVNAATTVNQTGGEMAGTATTPLYALTAGTMSGTATADLYAQTGGLTSGTVGGAQYDLSGGSLTGTSNSATFNLSGAGSVAAAGTVNAGTTVNQTGGEMAGTATTPLYALSGGTMSGTATADLYAQTGGLTSGTVGGAQYDLSGGSLTGTSNSATFNLSGAGTVAAAGTVNAGTTVNQTGGEMAGTATTPLYALSGGTMSGTANATSYAQTGGDTSGTVNGGDYALSGGVLSGTGAANVATFNLTGAGAVEAGATIAATTSVTQNGAASVMAGTVTATPLYSLVDGTMSGGVTADTFAQSGGTMSGNATVATYAMTGGTLSGTATASTLFDMQAGTVSGVLAGAAPLVKSGAGTVTLSGVNTYTGSTTVEAGTLALAGAGTLGAATNSVTVNGGELALGGTTQTQAAATLSGGTISGGTLSVANYTQSGGTLAADATVSASQNIALTDGGLVAGVLAGTANLVKSGAGTATLTGANTYSGTTTVQAGTLALTGAGSLASTSIAVTGGSLTTDGGALSAATAVALSGAGNFTLTGAETIGQLAGDAGTTVSLGDTLTLGGSNADTTFAGVMSGAGGLTKVGTGVFRLTNANVFTGQTAVNAGTLFLDGGSLAGPLAINSGGTLRAFGQTGAGATTLASGGTIDLRNGSTADTLTLGGLDLEAGSRMRLDIDLNESGAGLARRGDRLVVAGALTGAGAIDFTNVGTGNLQLLAQDVLVIDAASAAASGAVIDETSFAGAGTSLPQGGVIEYAFLRDEATGDWVIRSAANVAAIASIGASIATTQAILGTVVNRPSTAFVTSGAQSDPDTCGFGSWLRGNAGGARASAGSVATLPSGATFPDTTEIDLVYGGAQAAFDFGCINIKDSDANVNVGLTAGYNFGSTSQNQLSGFTGAPIITDTQFQSRFLGAYATYTKGAFKAELQGRFDSADFSIQNQALGINDTIRSRRSSISASAEYTFFVNDFNITPQLGFTFAQTRTDPLDFGEANLRFETTNSLIGLAAVSIAKTIILPDEISAIQPFATAAVYSDFGDDFATVFTDNSANGGGATQRIVTQNTGTFGELSLGVGYFRLFEDGQGPAKELSASIRGDVRFSDRIVSGGLTAQVRLQF